jgi:hypothetical protein
MALAGAGPRFEILSRKRALVKFVAVIQLTDIFDRRIIPRLAARQVSGCSAAW